MWNLANWTNRQNRDRLIEREQSDSSGGGVAKEWRDSAPPGRGVCSIRATQQTHLSKDIEAACSCLHKQ